MLKKVIGSNGLQWYVNLVEWMKQDESKKITVVTTSQKKDKRTSFDMLTGLWKEGNYQTVTGITEGCGKVRRQTHKRD